MAHQLPELPYAHNALEPHIDTQTMQIHHGKHHQAYIDKLNAALEGLDDLAALSVEDLLRNIGDVPESQRQAVINNGGGHANHCLFWTVMSPNGGGDPSSEVMSGNRVFFRICRCSARQICRCRYNPFRIRLGMASGQSNRQLGDLFDGKPR